MTRKGGRRLLGLLLLCLAVLPPGAASGQEKPSLQDRFPPPWDFALRPLGDDSLYLLTSPLRMTGEDVLVVGGVGALIGGLLLVDRPIRDEVRHPRDDAFRDAASAVSLMGFAPVLLGANVSGIVVGEAVRQAGGSSKHLETALVATEAQLFTLGITEGIAYLTARSRPTGGADPFRFEFGRTSFPSSHASQAFAVAAVVAHRYEQPVPVIAYGLAGAVGLSRLVLDKHWASDVVAGAALGWAIGRALSVRHSSPHGYLDFFPFADLRTGSYGIVLRGEF